VSRRRTPALSDALGCPHAERDWQRTRTRQERDVPAGAFGVRLPWCPTVPQLGTDAGLFLITSIGRVGNYGNTDFERIVKFAAHSLEKTVTNKKRRGVCRIFSQFRGLSRKFYRNSRACGDNVRRSIKQRAWTGHVVDACKNVAREESIAWRNSSVRCCCVVRSRRRRILCAFCHELKNRLCILRVGL
jgi:hypothetical protein